MSLKRTALLHNSAQQKTRDAGVKHVLYLYVRISIIKAMCREGKVETSWWEQWSRQALV